MGHNLIELETKLETLQEQKATHNLSIGDLIKGRDKLSEQVKAINQKIETEKNSLDEIMGQIGAIEQKIAEVEALGKLLETVDRDCLMGAITAMGLIENKDHKVNGFDGKVQKVNTALIEVDSKRFQFKIMGQLNATGSVGSLSGCHQWDDNLAGLISVWQDDKGHIWVVNGHNRLELAKKLGVDSLWVRFLDAKNAKEARKLGALINLGEGQGTAIDVAKFLKDSNLSIDYLNDFGINTRSKLAKEGIALSNLADHLFQKAINGDLPLKHAIAIGDSNLSENEQNKVWEMTQGKKIAVKDILEITDLVRYSPTIKSNELTLLDAMGFDNSENLALIKASLQSDFKSYLNSNKRLFDTVSKEKNLDSLEMAKVATVDTEKASEQSSAFEKALLDFDLAKNGSNKISLILNQAAKNIKDGKPKNPQFEWAKVRIVQILLGDKMTSAIATEIESNLNSMMSVTTSKARGAKVKARKTRMSA